MCDLKKKKKKKENNLWPGPTSYLPAILLGVAGVYAGSSTSYHVQTSSADI
jgi:hypothetical protein